jgi:hypothetical protein
MAGLPQAHDDERGRSALVSDKFDLPAAKGDPDADSFWRSRDPDRFDQPTRLGFGRGEFLFSDASEKESQGGATKNRFRMPRDRSFEVELQSDEPRGIMKAHTDQVGGTRCPGIPISSSGIKEQKSKDEGPKNTFFNPRPLGAGHSLRAGFVINSGLEKGSVSHGFS